MKISLISLAALALGGAGCVVVTHHDLSPGDPLDAQLYLTWETKEAGTGAQLDCISAGADTVRVSAKNSSTGSTYSDLFDCRKGVGTTYSLTAGDYDVNVDLVNCEGDASCRSPVVVSSAAAVGPLGVWGDGELDLGHFIFLVD